MVDSDKYYIYGTGSSDDRKDSQWHCYYNASGSLSGPWKRTDHLVYERPKYAIKDFWAPEVHKYNGNYYMFATYFSSKTQHRGCTILKSSSPTGPFVEITNGHITPREWDAIDGTLYVDQSGQAWMVFVHEWTSTDDGVGRMAVARLAPDLTHFISEPIELFRADAPSWTRDRVTDGCFLFVTKNNNLLMLWSNFCADGYCVGIARSKNGLIDGEWEQDDNLLFSKKVTDEYDGGHGMIFRDHTGQAYLCIHSPNSPNATREETPVLFPIKEERDTLAIG